MDVLKKVLFGAIGVGLVIMLIVLIVNIFKKGESDVNRGVDQYANISEDMQDIEKTYYHGKTISGEDVVEAIKKFKNDYVSIVVTNGKKNESQYINVSSVTDDIATISTGTVANIDTAQSDTSNSNYINPSGTFKGAVYRDANGLVVRIEFTQQ